MVIEEGVRFFSTFLKRGSGLYPSESIYDTLKNQSVEFTSCSVVADCRAFAFSLPFNVCSRNHGHQEMCERSYLELVFSPSVLVV